MTEKEEAQRIRQLATRYPIGTMLQCTYDRHLKKLYYFLNPGDIPLSIWNALAHRPLYLYSIKKLE